MCLVEQTLNNQQSDNSPNQRPAIFWKFPGTLAGKTLINLNVKKSK